MTGRLPTRVIAGLAAALVLAVGGTAAYLRFVPAGQVRSQATPCVNKTAKLPTLFSDSQLTYIRLSNPDLTDMRVLRTEPANVLPGMFDPLLALTRDSRRLAYVTASTETMDDAHLWWIDVARPDQRQPLGAVPDGLAPVRPAWSPDGSELAYVVRRAAEGGPTAVELWVARVGEQPAKRTDLPADTFAGGRSAALCWTGDRTAGVVPGLDPVQVQPNPFTEPAPPAPSPEASAGGSPPPASGGQASGSPCGVPVMSQNDPAWRHDIMQTGGDPIGGFGCALTSTAMLLNYYGASITPAQLNACLGPAADPLYWGTAPGCTQGRVAGGRQDDFSWERLDQILGQGRPAIVGMIGGITGMHFVVVTQGGAGLAQAYRITDPWDGTVSKSLGSYTSTGSNPRWIITYDGPERNCGRLVKGDELPITGPKDGQVFRGPVKVTVPNGSSGTVVKQPSGGGTGGASPSPEPSPSPSESPGPSGSPTVPPPSVSVPQPRFTLPVRRFGGQLTIEEDGVYLVIVSRPRGSLPPLIRYLKFTIDRTPPRIDMNWLNPPGLPRADLRGPLGVALMASVAAPQQLLRPGQLRVASTDWLSGVASVQYRLDEGDWTTYADNVSFFRTITVPTAGAHSVSVRAADLAGNIAEADDMAFEVVDPEAPPPAEPTPTPTPTAGPRTPTPVVGTPTPTAVPTPAFRVTGASLQVRPTQSAGQPCPVTFTFSGTITVVGTGTLTYKFIRSDGAIAPVQTVPVRGPDTTVIPVSTTWTLSALGTRWEAIQVLTPQSVQSNMATFTLVSCATPTPVPG